MKERGGKIDELLKNGEYEKKGEVEDLKVEEIREKLEENLLGWKEMKRSIIKVMRKKGNGRIVNC